jgi:hypothetical protein
MPHTTQATEVEVSEENAALTVGFGGLDGSGIPKEYILLQRSLDAREDVPGIRGVYIERDDQLYSTYGGIEAFQLHRDRVCISLGHPAAETLGVPAEVEVHFSVEPERFARIRAGLERIFTGCGCFTCHV